MSCGLPVTVLAVTVGVGSLGGNHRENQPRDVSPDVAEAGNHAGEVRLLGASGGDNEKDASHMFGKNRGIRYR